MTQPAHLLPSEAWGHVFSFLSAADMFSVRAACTYFKTLIDHGSLWKHWSAALDFPIGSYNSGFWATLRRRKVTSAVTRSGKVKHWKELATSLPALTTLVIERSSVVDVNFLKGFPNLKRLAIRNSDSRIALNVSSVRDPLQLTHISLCDVTFNSMSVDSAIGVVTQFANLTSLVLHKKQWGISLPTFKYILTSLPKLKHLSLHFVPMFHCVRYSPGGTQGQVAAPLSSFEIFTYTSHLYLGDAVKLIPSLKRLAVFYSDPIESVTSNLYHITTWLRDLPQLSTLVIVKGPPVRQYVTSIPATVTSLTLCVSGLSSEDMRAVAAQVPHLEHLHIDPSPSHLGGHASEIPKLFPNLRSLKLRHEHIPEKNFLDLHQLKDLKILEIVDSHPKLFALIGKLRILTKYRLQVILPPRNRDVLSCPCVYQVY